MKMLNRVVSLLMIIFMLVTSVPCVRVSAAAEDTKTYTLTVEDTYASSFSAADSAEGAFSFFGSKEFNGCYGYQLSDLAREIYGSLVNYYGDNKNTGEHIHGFLTPFTFDAEIDGGSIVMNGELEAIAYEIRCAVQIATDAFRYDHPEVFWMYSIGSSYSISATGSDVDGYVGEISSINIIPEEIYEGASAKISQYETAVGGIYNLITDAESRYDILKTVHDYICQFAYYKLVDERRVHSSEPFFVGDNGMVCEGYAKTFKVLCDELDIPCVLVSGNASGAHMWNYVQMEDGKWYLVDATWDDQNSRIFDTYFLANANTVGFNDVAICEERTERTDFSGTGIFSFTYPVLSDTTYTVHIHEWDSDYTVDVEPTCTEKGSKSIHCKTCDETKSVTEISATNHPNKTEYAQQDATCTEDGFTAGTYCPDCKTRLEGIEIIPKKGHLWDEGVAEIEPSCEWPGEKICTCLNCGKKTDEIIPATGHSYENVTTKATLTKNGKVESKCTFCDDVAESTAIYYPKTIRLSKTSFTYNGKEQKPTVTVKDSKGNTVSSKNYTVSYESGCKATGKYTVTIKFKGNYEGTKKLTFTIIPKVTGKITATQTTSTVTLKWNKVTGADGYAVYQYKSGEWKKIKTVKTTSCKVEGLKAGTKEKFKVKAYTKDDGTIWGDASAVFETATKCKTPSITKLTTTKGKASFTWSDVSGESGYQVYYSTKKDSGFKKVASYKANVVKGSMSELTSGKTYYFKVRAYTKTAGGTVYSSWSAAKSVKVK